MNEDYSIIFTRRNLINLFYFMHDVLLFFVIVSAIVTPCGSKLGTLQNKQVIGGGAPPERGITATPTPPLMLKLVA